MLLFQVLLLLFSLQRPYPQVFKVIDFIVQYTTEKRLCKFHEVSNALCHIANLRVCSELMHLHYTGLAVCRKAFVRLAVCSQCG